MPHLLYHCFSRRYGDVESSVAVFRDIVQQGLMLCREAPQVKWPDPCGSHRRVDVTQYRVCFTSLNSDSDLREHCSAFGPLGIGFSTEVIRGMGGFPVFYLPSPLQLSEVEYDDRLGVSLIYRLAELRALLEKISTLPSKYRDQLYSEVSDVSELEGAIRFLGNVLYFTDYARQDDVAALRYYRQREWRLIAGLTGERTTVTTCHRTGSYVLREYRGVPVYQYIQDVVVDGSEADARRVDRLLHDIGVPLRCRRLQA